MSIKNFFFHFFLTNDFLKHPMYNKISNKELIKKQYVNIKYRMQRFKALCIYKKMF